MSIALFEKRIDEVSTRAEPVSPPIAVRRYEVVMENEQTRSPSDYLAAERTPLAWMRTGLALMGFGFVVARFGLFCKSSRLRSA